MTQPLFVLVMAAARSFLAAKSARVGLNDTQRCESFARYFAPKSGSLGQNQFIKQDWRARASANWCSRSCGRARARPAASWRRRRNSQPRPEVAPRQPSPVRIGIDFARRVSRPNIIISSSRLLDRLSARHRSRAHKLARKSVKSVKPNTIQISRPLASRHCGALTACHNAGQHFD